MCGGDGRSREKKKCGWDRLYEKGIYFQRKFKKFTFRLKKKPTRNVVVNVPASGLRMVSGSSIHGVVHCTEDLHTEGSNISSSVARAEGKSHGSIF